MNLNEFKRQFLAWVGYREIGDPRHVWSDPNGVDSPWYVKAVVSIEELPVFGTDDAMEEFENLLVKHGLWYEQYDHCTLWIYNPKDIEPKE